MMCVAAGLKETVSNGKNELWTLIRVDTKVIESNISEVCGYW